MTTAALRPFAAADTTTPPSPPRYIAVEGPIGVGKTTLARRLANTLHYPLVLEPAAENPFLGRFYRDGRRDALPTQLYFLLSRTEQVARFASEDMVGPLQVTDFLIEKDRLFAQATLTDDELKLYEQIVQRLAVAPPKPGLVIYLQAPVPVLAERIRQRGIDYEQRIDAEYLETLCSAYAEFFHYYDDAPLLIVNAAQIDFAHNERHYDALLSHMFNMDGVRQYFNPNPSLL